MKAALYIRVSTSDQSVDNQLHDGHKIVEVYSDNGISGAKGRGGRPGFNRLLKDAAHRKFDLIMAWSVDRLGRSLQDLVGFLGDIHAAHIDLYLHQQRIDTTTPAGKALFQMMGSSPSSSDR